MRVERSAGTFVFRKTKGGFQLLLLERLNEKNYDLPKGHIEAGEDAEMAAKRETFEETGLRISFVQGFRETTHYFFTRRGRRISKFVVYFLALTKSQRAKVSHEHKGYRWCSYKDALRLFSYKDSANAVRRAFEYIKRKEQVDVLNGEYAKLPSRIHGWNLSRRFVPGEGPLDARVMLVGQAPGENEDKQRRPFVGRSGKLLTQILKEAGIDRKTAYICSVVQFFPPKNRAPTTDEIGHCKDFLTRQMKIVNPRTVVLLGNIASHSVLGIDEVKRNHGRTITRGSIRYLLTFHPAAVLRFKTLHGPMVSDLKGLKQTL